MLKLKVTQFFLSGPMIDNSTFYLNIVGHFCKKFCSDFSNISKSGHTVYSEVLVNNILSDDKSLVN